MLIKALRRRTRCPNLPTLVASIPTLRGWTYTLGASLYALVSAKSENTKPNPLRWFRSRGCGRICRFITLRRRHSRQVSRLAVDCENRVWTQARNFAKNYHVFVGKRFSPSKARAKDGLLVSVSRSRLVPETHVFMLLERGKGRMLYAQDISIENKTGTALLVEP